MVNGVDYALLARAEREGEGELHMQCTCTGPGTGTGTGTVKMRGKLHASGVGVHMLNSGVQ